MARFQCDRFVGRVGAVSEPRQARGGNEDGAKVSEVTATLTECVNRSINHLSGVDLNNLPDANEILNTTEETTHLCQFSVVRARTIGTAISKPSGR